MSVTITNTNKRLPRETSLVLTPSKKRRLNAEEERTPTRPQPTVKAEPGSVVSSAQAIWSWTLTEEAVAPCFVKDVYEMKENGVKDCEFFWLGRIPCRTIFLIGIVVAVQVYERRAIYTIDDGSSTIDCIYTYPTIKLPPLPSPKKTSKTKPITDRDDPLAKYRAPPPAKTPKLQPDPDLPPPPPPPLAEVGQPVRLRGRVIPWKEKNGDKLKRVLADSIVLCLSSNEEAKHWTTVLDLHRTHYFDASLGPFVIPSSAGKTSHSTTSWIPSTPSRQTPRIVDPTFTSSSLASSSAAPSSPVMSPTKPRSTNLEMKAKLRHPSRLHSRDLTDNTFRIYVKHYMDNAPIPTPLNYNSNSDSEAEEDVEQLLATPTQSRRAHHLSSTHTVSDMTPRPSRNLLEHTPRAPCARPNAADEDVTARIQGFTLSYLRRVPELSSLARRVVAAEGKRRARKEKHAAALRETPSSSNRSRNANTSQVAKLLARAKTSVLEPPGPKMKRLFNTTIRKLYEEGSIILWNGPVRSLPKPDILWANQGNSNIWKGEDKNYSGDSSIFSLGSKTPQLSDQSALSTISCSSSVLRSLDESRASKCNDDEDDEGALSDPPSTEDAYVPLTPALLAPHVENAITTLGQRYQRQTRVTPRDAKRAEPGATKSSIASFLVRSDERWAKVGGWIVEDTLAWLEEEGRAWLGGDGRWELCI